MKLTAEEQAMAEGREGAAVAFAMDMVLRGGRAYGAARLVPISFAEVGTNFATISPHIDLLDWLANEGARVRVPTVTNNGIFDRDNPDLRRDDFGRWAAQRSRDLAALHEKIGCRLTLTCAPYQLPGQPEAGDHIACTESNAVAYFNSVRAVRCEKYGDYFGLAAALCGRVPEFGLHTDAGRRATLWVDIAPLSDTLAGDDLSYQLIGHALGRISGGRVPVLTGLDPRATKDNLRSLGAAASASGAVPLFHAVGLTPEAPTLEAATGGEAPPERDTIGLDRLRAAMTELGGHSSGPVDAVVIGTPHASLDEVERLARLVSGRKVRAGLHFYVQMNRVVLAQAAASGALATLRAAGIVPVSDTCLYWRPNVHGISGHVVTNSAKYAYYGPGELNIRTSIASLAECVESAVRGEVWRDPLMTV